MQKTEGHLPVLFFVPYAGGSACSFQAVRAALADVADVRSVNYPGRMEVPRDDWAGDCEAMIDCVLRAVQACGRTEVTLWGHSLGAIVAVEAAYRLVSRGNARVRCLIASACRPPHLFKVHLPEAMSDRDMLSALALLGGMPRRLLEHPRSASRWLPVLKADLEAGQRYRFVPRPPLPVPITVLGGRSDPLAPPTDMEDWRQHTREAFSHRTFEGGHFFVHEQVHQTVDAIVAALMASRLGACQAERLDSVASAAFVQ